MRGLDPDELRLLREIVATGDFTDGGSSVVAVIDRVEERGLFRWWYGPRSRDLDAEFPGEYDGEEVDPAVTPLGRLVLAAMTETTR